jgi:tryptophan-rich sensory protein
MALSERRHTVLLDIVAAVGLAAIINLGIFISGYRDPAGRALPIHLFRPSAATIGGIWIGLFAALAWCRSEVLKQTSPRARGAARWIQGLIVVCALYPVYTKGLQFLKVGLIGNVATAVVCARVAWDVYEIRKSLAIVPAVVIAWLAYASLLIIDQVGWWS